MVAPDGLGGADRLGPAYAIRPSVITSCASRIAAAPVPSTSCPLRMIVVPRAVFMGETL